ncbi:MULTISPECIES: viperin family antiviral radical SAM protein [Glaesserella]|uniref:S-adenosylmethionine-dependent nucleotide dehydratase n=1 Tax=Glaesserella australis TaxID=2094024 RepID=A0A328BY18_9PAST|nr:MULTISPECIES: viperin family antiviral radical SAM protein [Glaesserella]AUI65283.1 radical SAM protein [Glaesserella sp. 15-184]RAL18555.1 radical SAM protein [Glaesserella australis]
MKELVVNWHITEVCNFKCQYCFAKWDKSCKRELFRDREKIYDLLDQVSLLLTQFSGFYKIRLNLVGGEIFLYPEDVKIISIEARKRGVSLSCITNGSLMNEYINKFIAKNFDMLGVSVDSINDITNIEIGRETKGKAIDLAKIVDGISDIRKINPNISIKINTVVNKLNYREYMGDFISSVLPDKWKVFKMLPIINSYLDIDDIQFNHFLISHQKFGDIISSENNDEMTQSYLMIDPLGRFFQNQPNELGYIYSQPILKVGIINALKEIHFDAEKFCKRYKT